MIDSNDKFLPEHYVAKAYGVPARILVEAPHVSIVKAPRGIILNVCIDYPSLTDDIKLLRKLKGKLGDFECFDHVTGVRRRFFSFAAKHEDAFWLHFGN